MIVIKCGQLNKISSILVNALGLSAASKFGRKTMFWSLQCLHHQGQFDVSVCMSQSTNSVPLSHEASSQPQGGVKLVPSPTFCLIP
jgi:hypothetical protein